ncbi:Aste57867_23347 [Aphanomyces stellatus]|uniref:RING-type E3 ubiquitin transferase n=1 Tax=Aphanomyces stellatus TaxID=120398 RepID=A0A485LNH7_9STRA|nr:hypothetical protein As57867_023276 [Aphanomyces stellatus]VFT99992.1 Aste57867_23347 [Aphanomyces stellatus]
MAEAVKKRRLRRHADGDGDDDDDDEIDLSSDPEPSVHATECTICCEKCMTSGEHRLASLACGHLFGQSCIEKWVKQSKTCPVCNNVVRRNDVRVLFTDMVAVVDNSRQEEFNQKYLAEKDNRTKMEKEVGVLKFRHDALQLECDKLKLRVMELLEENSMLKADAAHGIVPSLSATANDMPRWGYSKVASIACMDARVCAISAACDLLCVGTKTPAHAELQHGLMQVSLMDLNHRVMIPLHRSAIRDVAISVDGKYVATTAMDNTLHITSPTAQQSILNFKMPGRPGWSCAWDATNPYAVHVGHHNGQISLFDMRRPGDVAVETLDHHFKQPVHAVRSILVDTQPVVVAATFSGLSIWAGQSSASQPDTASQTSTPRRRLVHQMHMDVKHCCAMATNQLDPTQLVLSTRTVATQAPQGLATSTQMPTVTPAQHFVVSLVRNPDDGLIETTSDAVLQGHTTPSAISRSAIWSMPTQTIVASGDVASHEIKLWDTASASVVRQFSATNKILVDVQHGVADGMWSSNRAYLATLASDELVLFKATDVGIEKCQVSTVSWDTTLQVECWQHFLEGWKQFQVLATDSSAGNKCCHDRFTRAGTHPTSRIAVIKRAADFCTPAAFEHSLDAILRCVCHRCCLDDVAAVESTPSRSTTTKPKSTKSSSRMRRTRCTKLTLRYLTHRSQVECVPLREMILFLVALEFIESDAGGQSSTAEFYAECRDIADEKYTALFEEHKYAWFLARLVAVLDYHAFYRPLQATSSRTVTPVRRLAS